MSRTSERDLEIAAQRTSQEIAAGIARASSLVAREGTVECVDCDGLIPSARRAAMPSAERCVSCQERHEGRH